MLENIAEEALPNGFVENPIAGSNPPASKKKRNQPGNPGKFLFKSTYLLQFFSLSLSLSLFMVLGIFRLIKDYQMLIP